MSVLKIAVASVLALSLVLGLALPVLADSDEPFPWTDDFKARIVKGTVTEVDEEYQEYFTVQSGEDEISIRVDENTRYFILAAPGRLVAMAQQFRLQDRNRARLQLQNQAEFGTQAGRGLGLGLQNRVRAAVQDRARARLQNRIAQTEEVPLAEPQPAGWQWYRPFGAGAGFSDIEVGDGVVVWLADGENLAKVVLIVKPAARALVSGTITDVSSETITIAPDDGEAVTLGYDEDTVFILSGFTAVEEGQLARAVYDREDTLAKKVIVYLPD